MDQRRRRSIRVRDDDNDVKLKGNYRGIETEEKKVRS
jgi:hypothetical protein